jgi:peptide/nickel transport system substrate-binding protein
VITALRGRAQAAEDTLLFYYAGHGLVDPAAGGELGLALPGAYEPGGAHVTVGYGHVRRELFVTAARTPRRIVILDCCWSGLALHGALGEGAASSTDIQGTAVLTATASTRQALSPPGEPYTAFTGALLDILEGGVPGGPPLLDVGTVFGVLKRELKRRKLPVPQLGSADEGARLVLARNRAADTAPDDAEGAPARGTADPPVLDGRAVADMVLELQRAGRYTEARTLQLRAARAGDPQSIRDVAAELRRMGHYTQAARLEEGAAGGP